MRRSDYNQYAAKYRKAALDGFVVLNDNLDEHPVADKMNLSNDEPQLTLAAILQGEFKCKINGQGYELKKGDVLALVDVFSVENIEATEDCVFLSVEFFEPTIEYAKQSLGINHNIFHLENSRVVLLHLNDSQLNFDKMLHEYMYQALLQSDHPFYSEIIQHISNIFIIKIIELFSNNDEFYNVSKKNVVSRQNVIFENFIKLLEKYSDSNREVKFYADKLNVTPKYLSAVTRIYTNKCASDNIEDFVMKKIKTLIIEDKCSIKEICHIMNFSSQSFFGRYFKRNTGMSPKEFMRKYS